jgi:hypothetical protein
LELVRVKTGDGVDPLRGESTDLVQSGFVAQVFAVETALAAAFDLHREILART